MQKLHYPFPGSLVRSVPSSIVSAVETSYMSHLSPGQKLFGLPVRPYCAQIDSGKITRPCCADCDPWTMPIKIAQQSSPHSDSDYRFGNESLRNWTTQMGAADVSSSNNLKLGSPSKSLSVVGFGPDDPSYPCGSWEWYRAAADLPHITHWPIKFVGCSLIEQENLTYAFELSLGLLEVALRVVRYWTYNQLYFWESDDFRQPYFVNPVPRQWLGPHNTFLNMNWDRLLKVITKLRTALLIGATIQCQAKPCGSAGLAGCSKSFLSCQVNHNLAQVVPEYFPRSHPQGPFYTSLVLMHEFMHWLEPGMGLYDVLVIADRAVNDIGACRPDILDDDGSAHKCYNGACAQALASAYPQYARKNIDNYAYLIRNIGMYWSSVVHAYPDFWSAQGLPYCFGGCVYQGWP